MASKYQIKKYLQGWIKNQIIPKKRIPGMKKKKMEFGILCQKKYQKQSYTTYRKKFILTY